MLGTQRRARPPSLPLPPLRARAPRRPPRLHRGERALTGGELHPGTDLVHRRRVAEEEEGEADDAGDDEHHGEADEERGGFEGARGQRGEVREAAPAGQLPGEAVADAVVEEPEIAGLRGVHAVANPVGLDEAHHVDDGKADGEDGPQHADGPRVPHIVGVVQLGSLLSREHRGGGGGSDGGSGHSPPPPPPPRPPPPPASPRSGDTLTEPRALQLPCLCLSPAAPVSESASSLPEGGRGSAEHPSGSPGTASRPPSLPLPPSWPGFQPSSPPSTPLPTAAAAAAAEGGKSRAGQRGARAPAPTARLPAFRPIPQPGAPGRGGPRRPGDAPRVAGVGRRRGPGVGEGEKA